ncbi:MAG: hypothetical protein KF761_11370 [Salinibacterium sp.]|nr:hypothetical protein [Salinibacterium sp.]
MPTRRVSIDLRGKAWRLLGVRPTVVVGGRAQPAQWGVGTWKLPADTDADLSVYLYRFGVTWGRAAGTLRPKDAPTLRYRAPWFPFQRGKIS